VDVRGQAKRWVSDEGEKYLDQKVKITDAPSGLRFDPNFFEAFDNEEEEEEEEEKGKTKAEEKPEEN